jgi:DNA modification methylase
VTWQIRQGDALTGLREMEPESAQTVVTSPPYWGLRDYGIEGQLGLEATPEEYVAALIEVFREVRRVLRKDGTVWLNLGDSYAASRSYQVRDNKHVDVGNVMAASVPPGLKPKDLCGIPWRVAFALQSDGWWLRSEIIWAKPNPMPESVTDRPTRSHEQIFLLTRSERYFYDADAVKEPMSDVSLQRLSQPNILEQPGGPKDPMNGNRSHRKALNNQAERLIKHEKWKSRFEGWDKYDRTLGRNLRSVWTIATEPYPDAHFATFPKALVEPCIKAGSKPGDLVLDPFAGAGTVGVVALRLGRSFLGIELSPSYCEMAERRIHNEAGLFSVMPT